MKNGQGMKRDEIAEENRGNLGRRPVYNFLNKPREKGHTTNGKALARQDRKIWKCVDCMAGIGEACREECEAREVMKQSKLDADHI